MMFPIPDEAAAQTNYACLQGVAQSGEPLKALRARDKLSPKRATAFFSTRKSYRCLGVFGGFSETFRQLAAAARISSAEAPSAARRKSLPAFSSLRRKRSR